MREQSRIVVVFPETQADRSVLFADVHSAAWGSTRERRGENEIKRGDIEQNKKNTQGII